jgi:predicted transcriptional regulator
MNTMADILDKELSRYFIQLNEAEKKSVLLMLKTFLRGRNKEEKRINIEQYNREIDDALSEAEAGDYITQEEMEKSAVKW